jgi:GDP-L-fucose synthase
MKRILVTGGTGMVGSSLRRVANKDRFIFLGSKDVDLTKQNDVEKFIRSVSSDIDGVIHLAAHVGGSQINKIKPEEFFSRNLKMNTNLLDSCLNNKVEKVISILSTCIYPELGPFPLCEDALHLGEPHPTTLGYSYSKRMLDIHSRAIRKQYGYSYKCLVPNNLYGINDNFHISDSHVIPSIIRKIYEAKISDTQCTLLGDGTPIREFTFSDDFAKIILEFYKNPIYDIMNVGHDTKYQIKEVAQIICREMGYDYSRVLWSDNSSNEQQQKICSYERQSFYDVDLVTLDVGLKKTIEWFENNYPNIRGIQ